MTPVELLAFLRRHRLGVLATVTPAGEPESAVVGVAFTDRLEIVFDTLGNTRKAQNLRKNPKIAFVVGWDEEITIQFEGIAHEPKGAELDRLKQGYFAVYPDGRERLSWPGITYFWVRPHWARYSDFNPQGQVVKFTAYELKI